MSQVLTQKRKTPSALAITVSLLALLVLDSVFFSVLSQYYLVILPGDVSNQIFTLNLLPIFVFSLLLWVLTARVFASFLLTAALFDAIFLASQMKLENLGQPLMAVDFISAFNMGGHGALLSNYFVSAWHPGILATLVALSFLLFYFEKPAFPLKLRWRILVTLVLMVSLRTQTAGNILNGIYEPKKDWQAWDPRKNLNNYGLLYSLAHDANMFASGNREYDEDRLQNILLQPSDRHFGSDDKLPAVENIVVILSESYFEVADLNSIADAQYDLPAYQALQRQSLTGKMTVPAYGGVTLRTEFELLTGIELDLFPVHRYPLISLVVEPVNSIAWDLKSEGYSTTGMHPNVGSFWNRDNAYPYLGFEQFLDFEEFKRAKRSGYYVSDDALTKKIKKEISDGEKQFIFAISMENHGPWKTGRPNLDEETLGQIMVPERLEGEGAIALQQYVYHQRLAQSALLDLLEDLDQRDSRSIVLFFGDHLPGMEQTFDELEFKNGLPRYEQTTPFLIYDTHRNLSVLNKPDSLIDVSLLGSMLLDLSMAELPEFHTQAERLFFGDSAAGETQDDKQLSDLQQLQLWRFWEAPVNKEGEAYSAVAMGQQDKIALEPLFCPVASWGPKKAYVGERFNEQPDGRSAFYVKTDCVGKDLEIRIDERALWTTRSTGIMTTALDADELVKGTGRYVMQLHERSTGRTQELGIFKVKKRWFSKPQDDLDDD